MTQFTLRVTIICPKAMIADANQFALCVGQSPSDDQTFGEALFEDGQGNQYAVASTLAKPAFQQDATGTLQARDYAPQTDLAAAERAQTALLVVPEENVPGAEPGTLLAIMGGTPRDMIAAAGLSLIET